MYELILRDLFKGGSSISCLQDSYPTQFVQDICKILLMCKSCDSITVMTQKRVAHSDEWTSFGCIWNRLRVSTYALAWWATGKSLSFWDFSAHNIGACMIVLLHIYAIFHCTLGVIKIDLHLLYSLGHGANVILYKYIIIYNNHHCHPLSCEITIHFCNVAVTLILSCCLH